VIRFIIVGIISRIGNFRFEIQIRLNVIDLLSFHNILKLEES